MANPLLPPPPPDPRFVLRGTQAAVHALHFCRGAQGPGHPLLLSGSLHGLVHIWNLQTRRTIATLDGHGGQCVTWLQTLPPKHQLLRNQDSLEKWLNPGPDSPAVTTTPDMLKNNVAVLEGL